ncbi:MAG: 3-hydroxyacyl-CoA dehydrogenase [bacterium]|nr:3-hydroxyacyl-CoA dehydrogenase [bacterium]
MARLISFTTDGEVGIITIENPPVNALSPGVPEGIAEGIDKFQSDDAVAAIVLIGSGRTFIAGADIREFGKITSGETSRSGSLHPLLEKVEDCPKPVVAAIHGTAFGGGLEVAMSCHYRVAVSSAQVGQPEVKLGIIPGAGGTQRLPRLAGIAKAVEMCWLGDPVKAEAALEAGIVDRIVSGEGQEALLVGAVAFAREVLATGETPPKTRDRNQKLGDGEAAAAVFQAARELAAKKRRGFLAPLKAIEAVEAATRVPFEEGIRKEAEIFNECLYSDQSKALIYSFFAERAARKVPDVPDDTPTMEIRKAAVVGAGTMGGGIAMAYANAGIPVLLKEVSQEALDGGLATIRKNYQRSVARGRLAAERMEQRLALIKPTLSFDDFAEADIIVEAVFENFRLKKEIFAELDKVARPGAVLASNTSTLNIDEIAAMTSRPESVIGHHFFSPANIMRLLEVVRGKHTSKEVIATSMALARRLRKVAVVVGNCHGFVGNRMFIPYMREAEVLVEEGAHVTAVDKALRDFGTAMGPLAVIDLAGLDVGSRVRKEGAHLKPAGARQPKIEDALVERGFYGQKTGRGWYRYGENREQVYDPEIEEIIRQCTAESGIEQREIGEQEILDRILFALINEGARILEDGYALRAGDIDVIHLNGYGFPAYRGGPMWYADSVGLKRIYDRVLEFEDRHGYWWRPAPLLKELAEAGSTFAEWDKQRRHARAGG